MKRVIIIGAGAIGLCAAHELSAAGHEVTVLEKASVGSGSSLHNAGYVCPSHVVPLAAPGMVMTGLRWMFKPDSPFYIKPRLDPAMARWLLLFARSCTMRNVERAAPVLRDLSVASASLFDALAREEGMAFDLRHNGLLMLFRTSHGEKSALEAAALAGKLGLEARTVGRQELESLNPGVEFVAPGGVYYPGDAHLTPALLMESLRRTVAARGVNIITSTSVTGFRKGNAGVAAVDTDRGVMAADEFVLAGGAWSAAIARDLRLNLPLQAGKGYSITLADPPVRPRVPFILDEARVAVTPMGNSLRLAGTMELAGLSTSITLSRVRAIARSLPDYVRGLEHIAVEKESIWAGLRPVSPDGLPYIGRFARLPNLIAATGHAMLGISLAPVTGRLVAEIVDAGKPSIDIRPLNPDRFS